MADTTTQDYSFVKPEVGASDDTWGEKLNANWDSADSLLSGMVSDIEGKVDDSRVLTDVPSNAVFTDTVYSKPTSEDIGYINGLQTALDTLDTAVDLNTASRTALGTPATTGIALLNDETASDARTTLGLGTAAQANVTTSRTDATAGRVFKVGDNVGITFGSNSNGEFTRFPDGTMICTKNVGSTDSGISTSSYPSTFITAPKTVGTALTGGELSTSVVITSQTTTQFGVRVYDSNNNQLVRNVSIIAIGRWK